MSWAEVKHAVNDTLGTEDFKPLNKIITDSWKFQNRDDDGIIARIPSTISGAKPYTFTKKLKFRYNGILGIGCTIPNRSVGDVVTVTVTEIETSKTFTNSWTVTQTQDLTLTASTDITAGNTYSVNFDVKNKTLNAETLSAINEIKVKGRLEFIPDFVETV